MNTRRTRHDRIKDGVLTLYDNRVPTDLNSACTLTMRLYLTIRNAVRRPDFRVELLALHSPLLGQSSLVSFPPLNNMLKFSGYSHFISGLISISFFREKKTGLTGATGGEKIFSPRTHNARQDKTSRPGSVQPRTSQSKVTEMQ